jgi:hypothetical protein
MPLCSAGRRHLENLAESRFKLAAIHARSALIVGPCSVVASTWCLFFDWPALFRSVGFFVLAVLSLVYWRYLLPEAKHISAIRSILHSEKQQ